MPAYDYRCTACGAELELTHRMADTVSRHPHEAPLDGEACEGPLERLIALVGVNERGAGKAPSDAQLERAGFTKYVRGAKGYEKAAGPPGSPNFLARE
jgi:putative FmdB family regulatory protein